MQRSRRACEAAAIALHVSNCARACPCSYDEFADDLLLGYRDGKAARLLQAIERDAQVLRWPHPTAMAQCRALAGALTAAGDGRRS